MIGFRVNDCITYSLNYLLEQKSYIEFVIIVFLYTESSSVPETKN